MGRGTRSFLDYVLTFMGAGSWLATPVGKIPGHTQPNSYSTYGSSTRVQGQDCHEPVSNSGGGT
jgi:hypothetical protein